jgi:hypothetical protein
MFALLTDQGTAAAETVLCGIHVLDSDATTKALIAAGEDVKLPQDFDDCSGNDELRCIICGVAPDGRVE